MKFVVIGIGLEVVLIEVVLIEVILRQIERTDKNQVFTFFGVTKMVAFKRDRKPKVLLLNIVDQDLNPICDHLWVEMAKRELPLHKTIFQVTGKLRYYTRKNGTQDIGFKYPTLNKNLAYSTGRKTRRKVKKYFDFFSWEDAWKELPIKKVNWKR